MQLIVDVNALVIYVRNAKMIHNKQSQLFLIKSGNWKEDLLPFRRFAKVVVAEDLTLIAFQWSVPFYMPQKVPKRTTNRLNFIVIF